MNAGHHLAPEAPRSPRGRRAPAEWTTANTEISTWFERDRASVVLNTLDGTTIIEWWDDDVHGAVEDGFLNPRDWHGSAVEYANYVGAQPPAGVREAPHEAMRDPGCPSGSQAYMVGYIHKISPSPQDVWGPVCLNDNAFSDGKTLGAALRKAHVLIPGGQVRQFWVEGDRVIVFPSAPGMTTYWHSIILTAGVQGGELSEAPRTQWPDWMILESVEKGHGMSPQAKDRAFELIDLGYIDATGTWRLTAKGHRALAQQASRVSEVRAAPRGGTRRAYPRRRR